MHFCWKHFVFAYLTCIIGYEASAIGNLQSHVDIINWKEVIGNKSRGRSIDSTVDIWTDAVVPYKISLTNQRLKKDVMTAMEELKKYTCVKVVPRSNQANYVDITPNAWHDGNCYADCGMKGGEQQLLLDDGCESVSILHEFMHTLGFLHEQQRPDRDKWVNVHYERINKKWAYAYDKQPDARLLDMPYDYLSLVHYNSIGFEGELAITAKIPKFQQYIGNAPGMSYCDIAKINTLYKCDPKKYLTKCDIEKFNENVPVGAPKEDLVAKYQAKFG